MKGDPEATASFNAERYAAFKLDNLRAWVGRLVWNDKHRDTAGFGWLKSSMGNGRALGRAAGAARAHV